MADGPPSPASASNFTGWIGTTIEGRYRLRELLGEGGMGAVFIATHLRLNKDVAVKIVLPEVAGNESIAERFRREARATAKIDNPHVVHAIDFGKLADGSDFFVLQLVQGPPLSDVLADGGPRPWPWVCEIGEQIADALVAVHAQGIVHRDLKPDNVLIARRDDGSPHVYVLDFGIARDTQESPSPGLHPDRAPLTAIGAVIGTPGYMSPQQLSGEVVDHRADLYALGVILWECLAARPLWDADTTARLFARQLREAPPRLGTPQLRPDVPAALARLIDGLLERSPGARPTNAEEVRSALALLVGEAKRAEPLAAGGAPAEVVSAIGGATRPELSAGEGATRPEVSTAAPPSGSKRGLRILVGAWLALVVVVVLILALRPDDGAEGSAAIAGAEKSRAGAGDEVTPTKAAAAADHRATAGPAAVAAIREQGEMPEPVREWFATVSTHRSDGQRQKAAREILDFEPASEVPEVARLVAALQMAESCADKKDIVDKLAALRDPRGAETLQRYEPRGFHACGRRDCYGCMRAAMAAALRAMGVEPSEQTRQAIGEIE